MLVKQTQVNDVTVFWADGPAPLRAVLTFGVGARDETFRTIGVTHLIEHLVMSTLPKLHHEHNASVSVDATQFYAAGRPEQIAAFLEQVCFALGSVPYDLMPREAGVLATEGGHSIHPTMSGLLHLRYGSQGSGLTALSGPGFDNLTIDHVREHAAHYFVAGNAVLTLTGPVPDGLKLPLPAGSAPVRPPVPAPATDGPRWGAGMVPPGAGLLLRLPSGNAGSLAISVLAERLTDVARHHHGLSYEIGCEVLPLGEHARDALFACDAREGKEAEVAAVLWGEYRKLAADGPTAAELAHVVEGITEEAADPRAIEAELDRRAFGHLFGVPYRPMSDIIPDLAAIGVHEVAQLLTAAMPSALLAVPPDVPLDLPGLAEGAGCARTRTVPDGKVHKPPLLARTISRAARGNWLISMPDGVAHRDEDGDVHQVRYDEVVGVLADGASRLVFGANGCIVPVDPDLFSGIESLASTVDSRVPAALCFGPSKFAEAGD